MVLRFGSLVAAVGVVGLTIHGGAFAYLARPCGLVWKVRGPPALSCVGRRHHLGCGASLGVGIGLVQLEPLGLLGQLKGLRPVLGLGHGGECSSVAAAKVLAGRCC